MFKSFFSVSGFTLLSRMTGFARDVMLSSMIGSGLLMDAFSVALRLPNNFRAIFGEGAFNAAFQPTYLAVYERSGVWPARAFSNQIFTLLFWSQAILLLLAWIFTPTFVSMMAWGFQGEPEKFDLAVNLTRITFPYLFCITLVTLHTATLNAHGFFAIGAFAPVLLNLVTMAFLLVAFLFPNAAYAAAYGVVASGFAQLALVLSVARRLNLLERFTWPKWTKDVRTFFRAFGPAVISSSGLQIAIFADTIIATYLPTGGPSTLYYAERLYQLPIGLVGVAAGTVLLPEMTRFFARDDWESAFIAQNRVLAWILILTAPFVVAFLTIPEPIVRAAFEHGAFRDEAARATASVLSAYGVGLIAIVAINALRSGFQAIGDTKTPMQVSLIALGLNLALKLVLFKPLGAVGIAIATSCNAWFNLGALIFIGLRRYLFQPDGDLKSILLAVVTASVALANAALWLQWPISSLTHGLGFFSSLAALALYGVIGMAVYGTALYFGLRSLEVDFARLGLQRLLRKVRKA